MMIFMLAAAMTITMLIATVFGLHQEAERLPLRPQEGRPARRSGRADALRDQYSTKPAF